MRDARLGTIIYVAAALSIGFLVARHINSFLDIRFESKCLPLPAPYSLSARTKPPLPVIDRVNVIIIPKGCLQDELYRRAVTQLADSFELRSGFRPNIVDSGLPPLSGRSVVVGAAVFDPAITQIAPPPCPTDAFQIRSWSQADSQILAITGGSRLAEVYGIYWLADTLWGRIDDANLLRLNTTISPTLQDRFVDIGGVGIVPRAELWGTDYLHHTRAFQDVFLLNHPYVDDTAFRRVQTEFADYLHHMISYGINGIIIDGFLEFVDFRGVEDGIQVYGVNSEYRKRHQVWRQRFGELFHYAHTLGLKVILSTDMLSITEPLANYLRNRIGGIDACSAKLWEIYGLALEELFDAFPYLDGVMIRIGEAGAVYNLRDWPYSSVLRVRTDESVRRMLRELLQVAEKRNKRLIFRNWSVGVGEIGNIHTNPLTYDRVLGGLNSPNLLVSTKYSMGDFYSYLPHNPTLKIAEHKRLVEFQARREFEAFNSVLNYMGPEHQTALLELLRENPGIQGIWLWTQRGGPLRAGPLSLYPFHGFWLPIDANVYATAHLAWNPGLDLNHLTEKWVRKNFGVDPLTVSHLSQIMDLSRNAVLRGFYIRQFARKAVIAGGLEPPPTFFIWDIVSGSSPVLSTVYYVCRDNLEGAIAEGFEAVQTVRHMIDLARNLSPETSEQKKLYGKLLESLIYEKNLFLTLAWYRKAFLSYYHWLETGSPDSRLTYKKSFVEFQRVKKAHLKKYEGDLDFPAYNFFAADVGMAHAQRSPVMIWLARILLFAATAFFFAGTRAGQQITPQYPGKAMVRDCWLSFVAPNRRSQTKTESSWDYLVLGVPFAIITVDLLTFSSFLSFHFPVWTLLALTVFVASLIISCRTPVSLVPLLTPVGAVLLILTSLLMGVVSVRGPLFFWYLFWTNPWFRFSFFSLSIFLLLWLLFTLFTRGKNLLNHTALLAGGSLVVALGGVCVVIGSLAALVGLESCLTAINNEMAFLPLSLSKVLGIATHLNISAELPIRVAGVGVVLIIGGRIAPRLKHRK
jgi:hypothetical protein